MSDTAVLVVDMMNSYQHPDAEHLIPNVEKIIDPLADLVRRARDADDVDLVYVNDNYGDFTADFSDIVRSACNGERPGADDDETEHGCRAHLGRRLPGLTASVRTLEEVTPSRAESPELVALLTGRRVAVLTGAGMSTDSGIPDYRGPDSPPSNPMTIRQFTSDPEFRQRYWARNHVGWRHMDETRPNAGHRAVAALEHAGVTTGVITQNVDLLHTKAGSRNVINLHGTYARVVCLSCGAAMSRAALAELLDALNPGFTERVEAVGGLAVAPDADAMIADTASFRYADCAACGGMLKPDIVYFGESVPKGIVQQSFSLVEDADALLVAGSSLTVFSGYRFVRHAAALGIPVAIVNRGPTRGDDLATVKVEAGCSELLTLLTEELLPVPVR